MQKRGQRVRRPRLGTTARTAAQTRILDAALDLIADHGVSGTSLQMIADSIGVTKAAVYHQFKTKDEIVIAVAELELAQLEDALEAAQAETDPLQARKVLLTQVIDMAVRRRRWVRTLQNDPIIVRLLGEHPPFRDFISELYGILQDERRRHHGAGVGGAVLRGHRRDRHQSRSSTTSTTRRCARRSSSSPPRMLDLPD